MDLQNFEFMQALKAWLGGLLSFVYLGSKMKPGLCKIAEKSKRGKELIIVSQPPAA